MNDIDLSLQADAAAVYADQAREYLDGLVAPLDDMWAAFADMATPHALLVDGQVVGCCSIDEGGQLLRFHVQPRFSQHSTGLLRLVLAELEVAHMMVCTLDPNALSTALDLSASVHCHALLYGSVGEPEGDGLDELSLAVPDDLARIVDFQVEATGMPREFLEPYGSVRLERQELLLHERDGRLLCVGELRRDPRQSGVAHVGLIVHAEARGQGVGSAMLASLVSRSREAGLSPCCSTEVTNLGARRAIERAGFRAAHRVLHVEFTR